MGWSGCEDILTEFPEVVERRRCCTEVAKGELDDGAAIREGALPPARCCWSCESRLGARGNIIAWNIRSCAGRRDRDIICA